MSRVETEPSALKNIIFGPDGRFDGSNLHELIVNTPKAVMGALELANYLRNLRRNPGKAAASPLDGYFNPSIKPDADNLEGFDNPRLFRRHEIFEADGLVILEPYACAIETSAEIQEGLSFWEKSVTLGPDGNVNQNTTLHGILTYFVADALEISPNEASEKLNVYAQEVAYFNQVCAFFESNKAAIDYFLECPDFPELKESFINAHLASVSGSEEVLATAMLAGHFLLKFEGLDASDSPSQKYLIDPNTYHGTIEKILESVPEQYLPPLLTGQRQQDLAEIHHFVHEESYHGKNTQTPDIVLLREPEKIQRKIVGEKHRHKSDLQILRLISLFDSQFIIDPEGRRTLPQAVIGNTAMAKVRTHRGWEYTASRWMPKSYGYFGGDNLHELPEIEIPDEAVSNLEVINLIKGIFDGQKEAERLKKYDLQTEKIYAAVPKILNFLIHDNSVPLEIRQNCEGFLNDKAFANQVALRFHNSKDQNINYASLFVREGGVIQARQEAALRFAIDFVEGVATQLIIDNLSKFEELRRKFGGVWINYNLSDLPDKAISSAINKTLKTGVHQTRMYDKIDEEIADKQGWTIVDWRKYYERFLYKTPGIMYLIWEKRRNSVDDMYQVGVRCVCLARNSIFNAYTYQQW